jgi:hypothetical protein
MNIMIKVKNSKHSLNLFSFLFLVAFDILLEAELNQPDIQYPDPALRSVNRYIPCIPNTAIIGKTLTVQQISNLVEINFKVGHFDVELQILLHGINMVENVVDNPGYNALHGGIIDDPLHGVGLAAGRLAIGENCSVIATQHI